MPLNRRNFIKGTVGVLGATTLSNFTKSQFGSSPASATVKGTSAQKSAQEGTYPANKMSADLPALTSDIVLTTPHAVKEIAPGLAFEVWSFNESGPGPHLHVKQGEPVNFTLQNTGMIPHSIDFHAAQVPWDKYYQPVNPGDTLEFTWTPKVPGSFMYHCGVEPVLAHISNGMNGGIIVQPENGWAEPAKEFVIVQQEWYLGSPDDNGVIRGDVAKMNAGTPDLVMFNGYFNQYADAPLEADPGELIRMHIVNCGPTTWSAFHVIGALFEAAYPDGNPANKQNGMQTVSVPPGGGYTVELRIPDEGLYPFVTHSFAYTGKGALGILKIGNPSSESSEE
jgi:nitrite reductase (NO-forming)